MIKKSFSALICGLMLVPGYGWPVLATEKTTEENFNSEEFETSNESVFLLDEVHPYMKPTHYKDNIFFSMAGKQYGEGFTCMGFGSEGEGTIDKGNVVVFNIQGKYKNLNFITGLVEKGNLKNNSYTVSVFTDGVLKYESTQSIGDLPTSHSVNIENCQQLAISIYSGTSVAMYDGTFGIADLKVTKSSSSNDTNYRNIPTGDNQAYLLDIVTPYEVPAQYEDNQTFYMGGLPYSNGFTCMGYDNKVFFNLDNKYISLKFTVGIINGAGNSDHVTFKVYKDGKIFKEYKMFKFDLPTVHTIDVTGCKQLILTIDDESGSAMYSGTYGIADIIAESSTSLTSLKSESMHRLYNPNSGEHFYSGDINEKNHLSSIGWKDEGIAWYAPKSSNTPVYRLYNKNSSDHHYTTDLQEKNTLVRSGWKDEGIGWYSDDQKGVALYRVYNPNTKQAGSHHYTTDSNERNTLVSRGWKDEGIAWYGMK